MKKPASAERDNRGLFAGFTCGVGWELRKDAQLPGARGCLGPVGDVQLTIDTGRVCFDGSWSHNELLGDLLIGLAQGYEMEDLQLTPGEWFNQVSRPKIRRTSLTHERKRIQ